MNTPLPPAARRDERELVARLAPESPVLFFRARRLLDDWARGGSARFRAGRVEDGCWSVLRGDDGWHAVRADDARADGAPAAERTVHGTARAAVAHALGGLLAEESTGLDSGLLQDAGLVEPGPYDATGIKRWQLTDAGRRLWTDSERAPRPASGVACAALGRLAGRPADYLVLRPEPAPPRGPFTTVRELLTRAALARLPDTAAEPREDLPEGTVLDSYADPSDVFLYDVGTPFHKRGLWGVARRHTHRFYRLRRPLPAFPAFPFEHTTMADRDEPGQTEQGRGHYLVDTIADLLDDGSLTETPDPRAGTAS